MKFSKKSRSKSSEARDNNVDDKRNPNFILSASSILFINRKNKTTLMKKLIGGTREKAATKAGNTQKFKNSWKQMV